MSRLPTWLIGVLCGLLGLAATLAQAEDSQADKDRAHKLATEKLDEAHHRSTKAKEALENLRIKYRSVPSEYQQLQNHQTALTTAYQEVVTERAAVCQLAANTDPDHIPDLQKAVDDAAGRLNGVAGNIQSMTELREEQLAIFRKSSLQAPALEARILALQADVSDLLAEAESALDKAGIRNGLVYVAREQGIDLSRIYQIMAETKTFQRDMQGWADFEQAAGTGLAQQSQRIEHSKSLLTEGLVCLAQLKSSLKAATARLAAATPVAASPGQTVRKWYVFCSGQTSVARQLSELPYSTTLGIGVFDNQADAQALANDNNANKVCEPTQSHCPAGTVVVPNLTGLAESSVTTVLGNSNLLIGSVQRQVSYSIPKDQVISQFPYVDGCVVPLTQVNVMISSGADAPDNAGAKLMTGMFIQPATLELHVGQTQQFDVIAEYSDNRKDVATHLATWSGGNGNTFVAKTPGVFTMTAKVNDFSRSATIVVKDYQLTEITIEPASATLQVGQSLNLRLNANYEHSRFDDATNRANWSTGGPRFSATTPGVHRVTAQFGGKMATARIEVLAPAPKGNGGSSPGSGGDPLAAAMMNDPTRTSRPGSGADASSSSWDPGPDGFSSVPVPTDGTGSRYSPSSSPGIDLDQQAQNDRAARQARDEDLVTARAQQDLENQRDWRSTLAGDQDDLNRQAVLAQRGLKDSQAQGQQASATGQDALDRQQQQRDDFQDQIDALEQAAAQNARSTATASDTGAADTGGLTSVTVSQSAIDISIWDHADIDGDIIILIINGTAVTPEITLKGPKEPFVYHANLPGATNRVEIFAVNEGTSPPNTASVSTSHVVQGDARQKYSINQKENASYGITISR